MQISICTNNLYSLVLLTDILDEWMQAQQLWQYLKPIFDSDDIQRQMHSLARDFSQLDSEWVQHSKRHETETCVLERSTDTREAPGSLLLLAVVAINTFLRSIVTIIE